MLAAASILTARFTVNWTSATQAMQLPGISGCTAEVHAAATTVYFIENETISNLAVCLHSVPLTLCYQE